MRLRIEHKMILGYLPIILLIFVITIFSYRSLDELNTINRSILNEDTVLIQAVEKMGEAVLAQESYGRRYRILDNPEMLDLFRQRDREFNELVDKVRALPHQEEINIDKLLSLHRDFNALFTTSDDLANRPAGLDAGEFDKAVSDTFDRMTALLQYMHRVGKRSQYLKMEKANSIGIRSFRFTALLSTLMIIIGLASVSGITRSISRAIAELKRATEIISQGNYDCRLQVNTKDELADLAASLRVMASRLSLLERISLDSSPLTRMPGGLAIENILAQRLESSHHTAFCMLDLDNFKSYNDRYGYAKGNDVIRATAEIIKSAVAEQGSTDDFVGHIGGDDFAVITHTNRYETICRAIIKRFDETIVNFYNESDRERGCIVSKNRQGRRMTFPIMTISIAVVTHHQEQRITHIEIGEIASELKAYAKSLPGSVFVTDRREKHSEDRGAENTALKVVK